MQSIHIKKEIDEASPEIDDIYSDDAESFELPIDIARHADKLIIVVPMVGAKSDDINLTINNEILYIYKAARNPIENVDNHYLKECHWGELAREVELPTQIDPSTSQAELKNGILKIVLPITKAKTRIIKVR
ncbi:MAG: Hsp20/alpha crystallin family protein [Patescibacteria group bacterium]|nr:Hsp20/alpha crystallin family protein [Patescibacteria group bacterium]